MATKTVIFPAPSGLTLTADYFTLTSDTATASAITCTEATNAKGWYTFTSATAISSGMFRVVVKEGSTAIAVYYVYLEDTANTFPCTDTPAVFNTSGHIGANVIKAAGTDWGSGAITAASIASGAITSAKFGSGAITSTVLAADCIGSSQIATDAIGSSEIATSAISEIGQGVWSIPLSGSFALSADSIGRFLGPVRRAFAQAGGASTITLDASAVSTNDWYKNCLISIVDGTGVDQAPRLITAYNGTTKVATVTPAWDVQPDTDTVFAIQRAGLAIAEPAAVRSSVGLASADLDTQLAAIEAQTDDIGVAGAGLTALASAADLATLTGYVDTEIAAIKAKTDNLPSDPADASVVAGLIAALEAKVDTVDANVDEILEDTGTTIPATLVTIAGYIDTEIGAIKTVVDSILVDTAEIGAAGAGLTALATQSSVNTVDSVVDAIKAVTDLLPDAGALTSIATASALATVDANVDSVLEDTGTTLPATLTAIQGATFDTSTDSLEAIRNRGDAAWTTATGFSTLTTLQVETIVAAAFATNDPPTYAEMTAALDALDAAQDIQHATTQNNLSTISTNVGAIRDVTDLLPDDGALTSLSVTVSDKTGFKLASDGLDSISTTAPSGVPSNFREFLVMLYRRFFKKVTKDSDEIKTYADDGTTVLTTQTYTSSGSDDTVNAAT